MKNATMVTKKLAKTDVESHTGFHHLVDSLLDVLPNESCGVMLSSSASEMLLAVRDLIPGCLRLPTGWL
jgi:hypothetical protein